MAFTSSGVRLFDNFSIGHRELDADHDRMIAAWRELETSRSLDAAKAAAIRLMAEAGAHFAREEMMMLQCGYPDLERHRRLHEQMGMALRRVLLSPLLADGRPQDFIAAMRGLMHRWMIHILGEDAKLAPYIRVRQAAIRRAVEKDPEAATFMFPT
jgi:hemerythrin-like metal-binding protein